MVSIHGGLDGKIGWKIGTFSSFLSNVKRALIPSYRQCYIWDADQHRRKNDARMSLSVIVSVESLKEGGMSEGLMAGNCHLLGI